MRLPVQCDGSAAPSHRRLSAGDCRRPGCQCRALSQPGRNRGDLVSTSSDQEHANAALMSAREPGEARILEQLLSTRKPGEVTKRYLDQARGILKERHFAGASGAEIVRDLTAAVDDVIRALYSYAVVEHDRRFSRLNQRLAVLARGG